MDAPGEDIPANSRQTAMNILAVFPLDSKGPGINCKENKDLANPQNVNAGNTPSVFPPVHRWPLPVGSGEGVGVR